MKTRAMLAEGEVICHISSNCASLRQNDGSKLTLGTSCSILSQAGYVTTFKVAGVTIAVRGISLVGWRISHRFTTRHGGPHTKKQSPAQSASFRIPTSPG